MEVLDFDPRMVSSSQMTVKAEENRIGLFSALFSGVNFPLMSVRFGDGVC